MLLLQRGFAKQLAGRRGGCLIFKRAFASRPDASFRDTKRFYEAAAPGNMPEELVEEDIESSASTSRTHVVKLDGRVLRTPGGRNIVEVPSRSLALALATEWDDQQETVRAESMPLMTLVCSAIELDERRRKEVHEEMSRYLSTDTICFHVSEEDARKTESLETLRKKQQDVWGPLLQWVHETYGGPMSVATDLSPRVPPHDPAVVRNVAEDLQGMTRWEITAIESMTNGAKSLVIPLALRARQITVEEAIEASLVEVDHQIEEWGLVEGGHDVDVANLRAQIMSASSLLWMTQGHA